MIHCQVQCLVPVPIFQHIASFCGRETRLSLRMVCKLLKKYLDSTLPNCPFLVCKLNLDRDNSGRQLEPWCRLFYIKDRKLILSSDTHIYAEVAVDQISLPPSKCCRVAPPIPLSLLEVQIPTTCVVNKDRDVVYYLKEGKVHIIHNSQGNVTLSKWIGLNNIDGLCCARGGDGLYLYHRYSESIYFIDSNFGKPLCRIHRLSATEATTTYKMLIGVTSDKLYFTLGSGWWMTLNCVELATRAIHHICYLGSTSFAFAISFIYVDENQGQIYLLSSTLCGLKVPIGRVSNPPLKEIHLSPEFEFHDPVVSIIADPLTQSLFCLNGLGQILFVPLSSFI